MKSTQRATVRYVIALVVLCACGGSTSSPDGGGPGDAGSEAAVVDAGADVKTDASAPCKWDQSDWDGCLLQ